MLNLFLCVIPSTNGSSAHIQGNEKRKSVQLYKIKGRSNLDASEINGAALTRTLSYHSLNLIMVSSIYNNGNCKKSIYSEMEELISMINWTPIKSSYKGAAKEKDTRNTSHKLLTQTTS